VLIILIGHLLLGGIFGMLIQLVLPLAGTYELIYTQLCILLHSRLSVQCLLYVYCVCGVDVRMWVHAPGSAVLILPYSL